MEKLTDELLAELLDSPTLGSVIDSIDSSSISLSEYLSSILDQKGLRRPDVIRSAQLNETFGYQIFTGSRKASRDNLLKIAFSMGLDLKQTNRLLRVGGVNELYCKVRRDAIIIFALEKGYSLAQVEEALYRFSEQTIG